MMDDIPEALRESPVPSSPPTSVSRAWAIPGWVGLVAIALGLGGVLAWQTQRSIGMAAQPSVILAARPSFRDGLTALGLSFWSDETLLGHHPYEEAPPETLVSVVADGSVQMRQPAAQKLIEMLAAARAEGITLAPLSGFRSIEYQQDLFFGIQTQKGQRVRERATVSAPPGYSEHHTGYAVDLGDANHPETHLEQSFAQTDGFRWLEQNAARYSFELSFDGESSSSVSYEPWHWRFVGDRNSLEIFYGSKLPTPGTGEPDAGE